MAKFYYVTSIDWDNDANTDKIVNTKLTDR